MSNFFVNERFSNSKLGSSCNIVKRFKNFKVNCIIQVFLSQVLVIYPQTFNLKIGILYKEKKIVLLKQLIPKD